MKGYFKTIPGVEKRLWVMADEFQAAVKTEKPEFVEVIPKVLKIAEDNRWFKFANMTVDSASEAVGVVLQGALMNELDIISPEFSDFATTMETQGRMIDAKSRKSLTNWDMALKSKGTLEANILEGHILIEQVGLIQHPYDVITNTDPRIQIRQGNAFNLKEALAKELAQGVKIKMLRIMNVLIYFSREMEEKFFAQLDEVMDEGGVVITGMASPNGDDFIYLIYQKINGHVQPVEAMFSPTLDVRPLWPIFDRKGRNTESEVAFFKALHEDLGKRSKREILRRLHRGILRKEDLQELLDEKMEDLRAIANSRCNTDAPAQERARQLRIAIFEYMQSVPPYESISGDLDPVYGPAQILAGWGGTCISKALLSGILLELAGYKVEYQGILFDWEDQRRLNNGREFFMTDRILRKYGFEDLAPLMEKLKRMKKPYIHFFVNFLLNDEDSARWVIFDATWDSSIVHEAIGDASVQDKVFTHETVSIASDSPQGTSTGIGSIEFGFTRRWNGMDHLPIAVKPLEACGSFPFGELTIQVEVGKHLTTDALKHMSRTLRKMEAHYFNAPEDAEDNRVLLKKLSDLFRWMRGGTMAER
ncbi:MAG: hypothetical protein WCH62_08910, partial [Candidatus Omnitrophota bacterium]